MMTRRAGETSAPWWVPLAIAILSILGTAYVAYSSNDKETAVRITAVEIRQDDTGKRLDRIEAKIDWLIDWAIRTGP